MNKYRECPVCVGFFQRPPTLCDGGDACPAKDDPTRSHVGVQRVHRFCATIGCPGLFRTDPIETAPELFPKEYPSVTPETPPANAPEFSLVAEAARDAVAAARRAGLSGADAVAAVKAAAAKIKAARAAKLK